MHESTLRRISIHALTRSATRTGRVVYNGVLLMFTSYHDKMEDNLLIIVALRLQKAQQAAQDAQIKQQSEP